MRKKTVPKVLNLLFFLIPILAIIVCLLWILMGITFLYSSSDPISIGLFAVAPIITLAISIFFSLKVFKNIQNHNKPFNSKPLWKAIVASTGFAFLLCIVLLGTRAINELVNEKPPQFFPFDDPQATYTIKEDNGRYAIHYKTSSQLNKSYACSYPYGEAPVCGEELNNDIEVMIADSPIDLKPFVNRNVKVTGRFIFSTEQCIASQCQEVGNMVGIEIDSINIQ